MTRSTLCLLALAILAAPAAVAARVTDVPVPGGLLQVDAVVGSGAHAAYVIIDFAGDRSAAPTVDTGPRDVYSFGYRYDEPGAGDRPTLGTMLDALKTAALIDFTASGEAGTGFGRFIGSFAVGSDALEPAAFPAPFWASFLLDPGDGTWRFLNTGIDSRATLADGSSAQVSDPDGLDGLLDHQDVFGFVTQGFPTEALPRITVFETDGDGGGGDGGGGTTTPEPVTWALLVFALAMLAGRRPAMLRR